MRVELLIFGVIVLTASVFSIAASSIGTEAYNKHPDLKSDKPNNYNYLIVNLVFAIIGVLLAGYMLYRGVKSDAVTA